MARLLVKLEGAENRPLNLRLGANLVGRDPDCDFQIDHSTISGRHCELILSPEGVLIRDCDSTNGTFVDGQPVKEAKLSAGQTVHLGDVQLFVETAEVTIAIPKIQQPAAVPVGVGSPAVMPPGTLACARHLNAVATYKCMQCSEVLCSKCVRSLKRQGGVALYFCPICNGKCQRIKAAPKKKTFMDTLRKTVKLPFTSIAERFAPRK
jgi:hypothetical protein